MSEQAKLDRRGFLAGAAGLTGVALSVGAWKPVFAMESGVREASVVARNAKVNFIGVSLDGKPVGSALEAEGGSAFTDVVISESVEKGSTLRKIPGTLKWNPISLKHGITMDKPWFDWLSGAISGRPLAKNGSFVGADENLKIISQTNFFNALITEVGFPALDAASKDAVKMTVTFQPQRTSTTGGGSVPRFHLSNGWPSKISVANFKLTINGMDTGGVTKIDALNFKLNYSTPEDLKISAPQFTSIDIPNMKITVANAKAIDFLKWHTDFVIEGNNNIENQKEGVLSFLSSDLKTEIFRLDLAGVGIFALDPDPLVVGQAELHTTAQLFVNNMKFTVKL